MFPFSISKKARPAPICLWLDRNREREYLNVSVESSEAAPAAQGRHNLCLRYDAGGKSGCGVPHYHSAEARMNVISIQRAMKILEARLLGEGSVLIFNGVTVSVEKEGEENRYQLITLGGKQPITSDQANELLKIAANAMVKQAKKAKRQGGGK